MSCGILRYDLDRNAKCSTDPPDAPRRCVPIPAREDHHTSDRARAQSCLETAKLTIATIAGRFVEDGVRRRLPALALAAISAHDGDSGSNVAVIVSD